MSELSKLLQGFALTNDVEGITSALLNWPVKDNEWLTYVEIRIHSPSTGAQQRLRLVDARAEWEIQNKNRQTPEQAVDEFAQSIKASVKPTKRVDPSFGFEFSEKEQAQSTVIETLHDLEDEPSIDLENYISSLDPPSQDAHIQHLINKHIYGLRALNDFGEFTKRYTSQKEYQQWRADFCPEVIMTNSAHSLDNVKQFAELERRLEILRRKRYFAYLLERVDADTAFHDYLEKYGSSFKFDQQSSHTEISDFETYHQTELPSELHDFYHSLGSLTSNIYTDIGIFSLSGLHDALKSDGSKRYALDGLGVLDMFNGGVGTKRERSIEAGYSISQTQFDYLNENYRSPGYMILDDNVTLVIYYDNEQRYGVVWRNQDDDSVYTDYLDHMLTKSLAQHSLAQIFGSLVFLISNPYLTYEDQRDAILSWRALQRCRH